MKTTFTLTTLLSLCLSVLSYNLQAQTTAIPDPNFEQVLINLGIDSDGTLNGQVLTADIDNVTDLNLSFNNISDLSGIEDFVNLEILNVSGNPLSTLDVSNNLQLKELFLNDEDDVPMLQITSLDLSNNINLEVLHSENVYSLESINLKNGNNSILSVYIFSYYGLSINCVQVDDESAANNNQSPYSNWYISANFSYSEDCSAAIVDENIQGVKIYPNPVNDVLYLNNPNDINIRRITVFDHSGKSLFQESFSFNRLDLSALPKGIFFIEIETEKGNINKKIIKN